MRLPVPSDRAVRWTWYLAALILAAIVAWLAWTVLVQEQRLDQGETDRLSLREQRAEQAAIAGTNADAVEALSRQVERLGGTPVVEPSDLPSPSPGPRGARGVKGDPGPGPTAGEIQTAVDAYCAGGRCDGRNPSGAQVAQAVARYCNARGDCRGARGTAGSSGRDGATGRDGVNGTDGVDGADAPPPTQEQVNTAVATYCDANGGCRGPQGDTGPAGPPGPEGDDGVDAVPFVFRFTVQTTPVTATTYTCSVTAPDQTVTCTSSDS